MLLLVKTAVLTSSSMSLSNDLIIAFSFPVHYNDDDLVVVCEEIDAHKRTG